MTEAESLIGYTFSDRQLLTQALTPPSYGGDHHVPHYQRLEFLGDAVLELYVSEQLYRAYPALGEGKLTRMRADLVREETLAFALTRLGLNRFIRLSVGEEKSGGRARPSLIADVTEALIGAIYVDGGMDEAVSFIRRFILQHVTSTPSSADYKSELQEYVQGRQAGTLRYVSLDETGPEHAKTFTTAVYLDARMLGEGRGKSKKAAQQQAAQAALQLLRDENG